jgi:hypothetical protein
MGNVAPVGGELLSLGTRNIRTPLAARLVDNPRQYSLALIAPDGTKESRGIWYGASIIA